ncbi:hypothetical protein PanWU01x14_044290 [Parasponia andersonii]|uniref:Uncharacterized protein n=1 Tax=Parasponia andersonii TaxID=3476 RepID=A0A2P5DP62_PARAD|nr:hypothetical protein PanWU01x14_044290 [Parasponia andersonii]
MTHEIPCNAENKVFVSEVTIIMNTIKDYGSYIKSLNEEIVIDEGRVTSTQAKGLVGDYVGYPMKSKNRKCLVQSYKAHKRAATQDLAIVKKQ